MRGWVTYILECSDASYYVGITNALDERIAKHNAGKGAKWTRGRRPVRLRYAERHPDKSSARRREIELKGWRREKKEQLFRAS